MPPGGKTKSGLTTGEGWRAAPPFINMRGVKPFGLSTGLLVIKFPFPIRAGSKFKFVTCFNFFSVTCTGVLAGH